MYIVQYTYHNFIIYLSQSYTLNSNNFKTTLAFTSYFLIRVYIYDVLMRYNTYIKCAKRLLITQQIQLILLTK